MIRREIHLDGESNSRRALEAFLEQCEAAQRESPSAQKERSARGSPPQALTVLLGEGIPEWKGDLS
jgi:hypothetical protein